MVSDDFEIDFPDCRRIQKWDGRYEVSDTGCGCCSGSEPLTVDLLTEILGEMHNTISDLEKLRDKMIEEAVSDGE